MGIRTTSFAITIMLMVLLMAGSGTPARADIYVKEMPDGSLNFSNCPLGKGWTVYMRERPRARTRSYARGPSRSYRRSEWDGLIKDIAVNHGVDPVLVRGIIEVESGFEPSALSPKGAMGLMQLMPATAAEFGVKNPFDPVENMDAGARLLKKLVKRYGGDLALALGAYNAGSSRVDSAGGVPRIPETVDYVAGILEELQVR